jgi:hypothetical protein
MFIHDLQRIVTLLSVLLGVWFLITPVEAANAPRPANPFADPKHDPYNPLKYIASNALTGVAFCGWFSRQFGGR